MSTKTVIIKPTRPVYSEHLARVYGNFILNTCVVNNSVALLEEAAYFMVHEGTLDAANPERCAALQEPNDVQAASTFLHFVSAPRCEL